MSSISVDLNMTINMFDYETVEEDLNFCLKIRIQ